MGTVVPCGDCARARAAVSCSFDDELSELGGARLAAHLSRCGECRAYADELAAVGAWLRAAPLERPERRLVLPQRSGRVRVGRFRVQAAAAALVLFAGASYVLGRALAPQGAPVTTTATTGSSAGQQGLREDSLLQHELALLPQSLAQPASRTGRLQAV